MFFRTNHSVESSLSQNKTLAYFKLTPSALVNKNETTKMEKRKIKTTLEVLKEWSVESPETKEFIDQKSKEKCSKGNILIEEVIYLSLESLETKSYHSKLFVLCSVRFYSRNVFR